MKDKQVEKISLNCKGNISLNCKGKWYKRQCRTHRRKKRVI